MFEISIAGDKYEDAESAARAYKAEVDKLNPSDAAARTEAEAEAYESILWWNDEIPRADFDAAWTEVEDALNVI